MEIKHPVSCIHCFFHWLSRFYSWTSLSRAFFLIKSCMPAPPARMIDHDFSHTKRRSFMKFKSTTLFALEERTSKDVHVYLYLPLSSNLECHSSLCQQAFHSSLKVSTLGKCMTPFTFTCSRNTIHMTTPRVALRHRMWPGKTAN